MKQTEIRDDIVLKTPRTADEIEAERDLHRRAELRVADQVAREHPHPLDNDMPRIAGAVIARDPKVRADLTELLDAVFGTQHSRPTTTHGGTA